MTTRRPHKLMLSILKRCYTFMEFEPITIYNRM